MKTTYTMALAVLASAAILTAVTETASAAESKITILYDAFGTDAAMKKDWGFSALVEVAGKRRYERCCARCHFVEVETRHGASMHEIEPRCIHTVRKPGA
jgi:cytochrome c5